MSVNIISIIHMITSNSYSDITVYYIQLPSVGTKYEPILIYILL
jgi:hypothetical protein